MSVRRDPGSGFSRSFLLLAWGRFILALAALAFCAVSAITGPSPDGDDLPAPPGAGPAAPPAPAAAKRPTRPAPNVSPATRLALTWLARHQDEDGAWSPDKFDLHCTGTKCAGAGEAVHKEGVTGLALLAFVTAGYVPESERKTGDVACGENVGKAIAWVISKQANDGCIGEKAGHYIYDHAICTLALAEAYKASKQDALKVTVQSAVDYLQAAQNPGQGWRYTSRPSENDTSVTGWAVMALKAAERAGLKVSPAAIKGAKAFLDGVTHPTNGKVGYTRLEEAGVPISDGRNAAYRQHEALTAIGLTCRRMFLAKGENDPLVSLGVEVLMADLPVWDIQKKTIDYYYWHHATKALYQLETTTKVFRNGAYWPVKRSYWKEWSAGLKQILTTHQAKAMAGHAVGSWTTSERWSHEGGLVYATALNTITLELIEGHGQPTNPKK